jgi:hypothetical protein
MKLFLRIEGGGLPPETIDELTRGLCRTLSHETDAVAEPIESGAHSGEKGVETDIGSIVLTLLSSGTVTSIIETVKAWLLRDESLAVEFRSEDGTKVKLNAKNLSSAQIDRILKILKANTK